MKKIYLILSIILLIAAVRCGGKQPTDDLISVDVTKSYSTKKELILQDFMEVEYIALETKDDFYNQGFVQAIGKEIILVSNRISDGYIFIYDRTGKALRKINRMGHDSGEYINITGITLDEENNEMYVHSHFMRQILVYNLYGEFKRSLEYKENTPGGLYTCSQL